MAFLSGQFTWCGTLSLIVAFGRDADRSFICPLDQFGQGGTRRVYGVLGHGCGADAGLGFRWFSHGLVLDVKAGPISEFSKFRVLALVELVEKILERIGGFGRECVEG